MPLYSLGSFTNQAGAVLLDAFLSYQTFGDASLPLIVYPTWYSGKMQDNEWLISTRHAGLNPNHYFIVVIALFGNGESSSPSNTIGSQSGHNFPMMTIYDNVKAQHQLVTQLLNRTTIFAVVGWSMGAGQAYQWATSYPDIVQRIIPFCGAARTSHHNKTFLRSLQLSLKLDKTFNNGNYDLNQTQSEGKKAFAAIYSAWGFSQTFYRKELFKQIGYETLEDFLTNFWDPIFANK